VRIHETRCEAFVEHVEHCHSAYLVYQETPEDDWIHKKVLQSIYNVLKHYIIHSDAFGYRGPTLQYLEKHYRHEIATARLNKPLPPLPNAYNSRKKSFGEPTELAKSKEAKHKTM